MKTKLLSALLVLIFTPSLVFAARPSINELNTRVNQLEAENNAQQAQIDIQHTEFCTLSRQLIENGVIGNYDLNNLPESCLPDISRIIFVTSSTYNGDLGGLAGADQKCQDHADTAGLPGTFKAWLSDNSISAKDRLTHSTEPYGLVNGFLVATDWDDLTDGALYRPINVDEHGNTVTQSSVWSLTSSDGTQMNTIHPQEACFDWLWSGPLLPPGLGRLLAGM